MKPLSLLFLFTLMVNSLSAQMINATSGAESEMTLKTSSGDIFGTLSVAGKGEKTPVVLIIAGSGPTDRDGNSVLGVKADSYKMISQTLAQNGISSLRYDKRGIAKSRAAMKSESELTFEMYINDVVNWVNLLKNDSRFTSVYILGHSEGSLIGMVAALRTGAAGFISVAGAGKPADQILQEQLKTKLPFNLLIENNRILDSLKAGKTVSNVDPALASLYRPSVQPYMISWLRYDPSKVIAQLKTPTLIVQGTTDLQVTVEDARLLSGAKPDAKLLIIENMNHVLKESSADPQQNMATYTNPGLPLKAELVKGVISFIKPSDTLGIKPKVYIIGSIHHMHFIPEYHYSMNDLITQITSLKPDLVCGEITREAFNTPAEGYFPPEAAWLAEMAPSLNFRFEPVDWRVDYATQSAAEALYPQPVREQCRTYSEAFNKKIKESTYPSIYDCFHGKEVLTAIDSLYEMIIGINKIAETAHGEWHERNRRIIENGMKQAGDAKTIVFVFGIDHIPQLQRQLSALGIEAIIPERNFTPCNNFKAPQEVISRWQRNLKNLQQIKSKEIEVSDDYYQKIINSKRVEDLQEAISKS